MTCTVTEYGKPFVSSVWKDNIFASQFHPEKSQRVGLQLFYNFGKLAVIRIGCPPKCPRGQWAHCRFWAGSISVCLLVMACVPPKVNVDSSPQFAPSKIQTLAILPFKALTSPQRTSVGDSQFPEAPSEVRTQFILPGEGRLRGSEETTEAIRVSEVAAKRITSMVYSQLQGRSGVRILPQYRVAEAFSEQNTRDGSLKWNEKVQQLGKNLGADAVLIGLVRIYRERKGSKIAATPAVVGFESHLIDSASGKVLWAGAYYDEQKPLNQDLMGFMERKGMYVTAEELARMGVEKMMKKFPVGQ